MTKREFYEFFIKVPMAIHEIFKEYYGEDRVDFNDAGLREHINGIIGLPLSEAKANAASYMVNNPPYVLVYWPEVTVKNENDKSVNIKQLYARIRLTQSGMSVDERGFGLSRAEYTTAEINSDYLHSHAQHIPRLKEFTICCLGDGPIKNTIRCLHLPTNTEEQTLDLWRLFCRELDVYVKVESLSGGPYHKLEEIWSSDLFPYTFDRYSSEYPIFMTHVQSDGNITEQTRLLENFCKYAIRNFSPRFNFDGCYGIGEDDNELVIELSNLFIRFTNEQRIPYERLKAWNMIAEGQLNEGRLCTMGNLINRNSLLNHAGETVLVFKGRNIPLVINEINGENHRLYLITPLYMKIIITRILTILNYECSKGKQTETRDNDGNEEVKIFL